MTHPAALDRYDRPDPCDDCGQPHRGDCAETWPEDDRVDEFWGRFSTGNDELLRRLARGPDGVDGQRPADFDDEERR